MQSVQHEDMPKCDNTSHAEAVVMLDMKEKFLKLLENIKNSFIILK